MRKPVVDYRKFRISKINDPEFSHLKLLFGWIGYFALYFITENFIPVRDCYVIHSPIDDMIPFCEVFVIPYVLWYLLIVVTLVYFALYNVENFKSFQVFIITTQVTAMLIYIIFPNMQNLRPMELPRDNFLCDIVGGLYSIDTNTNVCPSLHVAYSLGIMSAWLKEKSAKLPWKIFVIILVILVCMSTVFIKQHSIIDFFAAIPVCVLAEILAYRKYYKKRLVKNSQL